MLDQRLSGTTEFTLPDGTTHAVYFHDGTPAKVRTGTMIEPLDRVLVDQGLLDESTLRGTLMEVVKKKVLHGRLLVMKALLSREKVIEALRTQVLKKVTHLFELPGETRYAYYKDENLLVDYGGPELTPTEPLATIMGGIRLMAGDALVDATLNKIVGRPLALHIDAEMKRFAMTREEAAVVDLMRTRRMTIKELNLANVAPEQVVRLTVYALVVTRHLDLGVQGKAPVGLGRPLVGNEVIVVPQSAPAPAAPAPAAPAAPAAAKPRPTRSTTLGGEGPATPPPQATRTAAPTRAPSAAPPADAPKPRPTRSTTLGGEGPATPPPQATRPAPPQAMPPQGVLPPAPQPPQYGAPQQQPQYGAPQPQYGAPQPQQPQYGAPQQQPQYGAPQQQQPQYGAPQQPSFPPPQQQPQYGAPQQQPQYGAPQPQYGAPQQPQYGAPQPQYGAPQQQQPQYGAPQPQYGAPQQQPQYGAPQPQYGAPQQQPQYGAPQPQYGAPQGQFGGPPSSRPPASQHPYAQQPSPYDAQPQYGAPSPHRSVPPPAPQRATPPPPAAPPPPPERPEIAARRAEIEARAKVIDSEDYFTMLGVSRDATPDQVKTAYFGLAKSWHPDRLPSELLDVKPLVARVFARFSEAYQTLFDPVKSKDYLNTVKQGGGSPEDQEKVARVVDAALEFQKAEILMKKNDLAGAEALVARAVAADPDQPEYLTLLVWVRAMRRGDPPELREGQTTTHFDDLIKTLDGVLAKEKEFERALYYRGVLLKRSGRADKAIRDFRLAAQLNPKNLDAVREVRLYEMRKRGGGGGGGGTQKGQQQDPGLFGKFFKR
ncbi:Integral membrane protein [Minicystis rosea]|nr:Integral membrane protein [Minicystis rosea]